MTEAAILQWSQGSMLKGKRRKLKKIGSDIPVIGFGSRDAELGNLYEMPLKASGKRQITLCAVVVSAIYNGPPATCPHDITWHFLQSRGEIAWDLHQPGRTMDICKGTVYPFLQPRHLEQEMSRAHCTRTRQCSWGPNPARGRTFQAGVECFNEKIES